MKQRAHIIIHGAVQGVGFRPFVYRLAGELGVRGWILNSAGGVRIEAEAEPETLATFLSRLDTDRPAHSWIQAMEHSFLDPAGYTSFEILHSRDDGVPSAVVLPDLATCPECLAELFTPADRRYRYPFVNCTHCGPRYSIVHRLPYDRPHTTMRGFRMCAECQGEYDTPSDRRFHAQPNACPICGPHVELWDRAGRKVAEHDHAIREAVEMLRDGRVLATKGIGGFHLMVDAGNEPAVAVLRARKRRAEKPFAVMVQDMDEARRLCRLDAVEERILQSSQAPIVLARRAGGRNEVAPGVAPRNPFLGIMLPSTPLHHIMMRDLGRAIVATSGNLSDEPLCIDEREAVDRLGEIADAFLIHNRPIVRHVDDSIVRVMLGREMVLRRARGFAPLPVLLPRETEDMLAVGAHLKNTVAVARGRSVFISQHLGDLDTPQSVEAFHSELKSLQALYAVTPTRIVSDLHPDYLSTTYAHTTGLPVVGVQHHYAHVASCMAENQLDGRVLGVSWDGTGYGPDGTVWGGEFLLTDDRGWSRVATFRTFRLPGGEAAVREPRRAALGLLVELEGLAALNRTDLPCIASFAPGERRVLAQMVQRGFQSPVTSSAGRLFDAVSALLGICLQSTFEGQGAMELEFVLGSTAPGARYPFLIVPGKGDARPSTVDWGPMILEILGDLRRGVPVPEISGRFHNTMAEIITETARRTGEQRVVLSGGCFQNAYLSERTIRDLRAAGFAPYWHQRVPPNDGGIALGQIFAAVRAQHKD
ncbi:MAG: (NiFe) hydrogenase maturation protein HypF [Bacteroidetes bacterium]|nr:(NiFe) hydrogenase maturation protein HypF [Bacteroidota bacterium]